MFITVETKGELIEIFADEYLEDGTSMIANPVSFSRRIDFTQDDCCVRPLLKISREIAQSLIHDLSNALRYSIQETK